MPFVSVDHRGLSMYYIVNPIGPVNFAASEDDAAQICGEIDPDKPIIVFLHARAQSSASFVHQFADRRLSSAFNLVGLDARMHGRTHGTPLTELSMEQSSACVTAVLDSLGYKSFALFGEGALGAAQATWIAINRPEKVKCLALASPGWLREPEEIKSSLIELGDWCCVNKDGHGDGTGAIPDECVDAVITYFLGDQSRLADRRVEVGDAFKLRYGVGHSKHDIMHVMRYGDRVAFPYESLAKIKVPVLILSGTEDKMISPLKACKEWQAGLRSAKGGADLRIVQGAPHLLSYTDYNIVNRMLAAFVSRSMEDQ